MLKNARNEVVREVLLILFVFCNFYSTIWGHILPLIVYVIIKFQTMKDSLIIFTLFLGVLVSAQDSNETTVNNQIEMVVNSLVDAWSKGDAELFASNFSEDADFTVWFGMRLNGRQEIAFGHNIIFKEFYANTIWDLKIDKTRRIGADVALVHCSGSVIKAGENSPSEPDAVPLLVFQKINDNWKITTLQNTPFAVNEFRANGDIRRMKKIMREFKN